jgi:hypothetical protein
MLARGAFRGERRVIDISGDGANNRGRSAREARDAAVAAGIGINGLPILALEPNLDRYYRDNVIGGPGAFVIAVERYEHFADAILNKPVSEVAGVKPAARLAEGCAQRMAWQPPHPASLRVAALSREGRGR